MQPDTTRTYPFIVALTGGIGSGKTAVSDTFATLGARVIDTDVIARTLVTPGSEALAALTDHFSTDILLSDGSLDRSALRHRVFNNTDERQWLESLLHPLIRQEAQRQIQETSATPYILLVIPLLAPGSHWLDLADRILVVDVPESVQLSRTSQRDRVPPDAVAAIIRSQPTREERLRLADDVIENTGTLDDLRTSVEALHEHYLRLSRDSQNH